MKVTLEMLEQYDACQEGIMFIKDNYPDGAEAMEIMNNPNIPTEMLHFAARYFPCTEEELTRYKQICKIENSKYCYFSEDLKNCIGIAESKHISDSEYIRNSQNVEKSDHIYGARDVINSCDVWNSFSVKNSNSIIQSKEIVNSKNILQSDLISWSSNILKSLIVDGSSYIYQSSKINDCHFGGFLTNCRHCLFCSNIQDSEYYIFNKQVDRKTYEDVKSALEFYLNGEHSDFIMIDKKSNLPKIRYSFSIRFDSVFNGLSPDFYGWIGTIPNYSESLFLQLFLIDNNLQNIKN